MKILLVVAACLIASVASDCNTMQRLKVKRQWTDAFGVSEDREAMSKSIFRFIYKVKPNTPDDFFQRVDGHEMNSPKFIAHMGRVLSAFDMCLSLLMDDGVLQQQLHHLEVQHQELKIPAEYFDIFSEGLQLAVHSLLGRCYDEKAWHDCTQYIEDGIKGH